MMFSDPGNVVPQAISFKDFSRDPGVHLAVRIGFFVDVRMRCERTPNFMMWAPWSCQNRPARPLGDRFFKTGSRPH
ncbi:MAG: hypothetical protein Ct9H300mP16_06790 [Pseudomonadota bacterium]|nr:MAG: hypothetical protein Ct9H300mP16_06790 [Pseudomonadota bacterium]